MSGATKTRAGLDRQAIWGAVRALARAGVDITSPRVAAHLSGRTSPVSPRIGAYLRALARAGILLPHQEQHGIYSLDRDPGCAAPRIRTDGSAHRIGLGRERQWAVMRVLGTWTPLELAVHASVDDHVVSESDARAYCNALARVGILIRTGAGAFRLVPSRWRGPRPPRIAHDGTVTDPNTGAVLAPAGRGGAA